MDPVHVSIFGDLFVTNEVLQNELEKAFSESDFTFVYNYLTDDWPVTPVMRTDEIREFVGSEDEVIENIGETEILITHTAPISRRVIESAPKLKVVGAARGGPVNINWDACTERGIPVLYAPGRNSGAVAEFTIGLMLAQSRNIARCHHSFITDKAWRGDLYVYESVGKEMGSSVVGLVGCGAIGKKVGQLAAAFGAYVILYDPFVAVEEVRELGFAPVDLETLCRTADFISLHARLTEETSGMIGAAELALMKETTYIVNTARGELIDHGALYACLRDGGIAGAALDVFEDEPPPHDSPLFDLHNVTATTHLAGASRQASEIGAKVLCKGIYDYFARGETPKFCCNAKVFDKE